MDGAENKPMIRIHLDQQVTIDAVSGHEEVEDATVITEITGFDVEDDLYVLRGALSFSGFLRMEDTSDTGHELPDAFDDRDVFATNEEMPEAPVMPFHHALPFVLQVPVAAQQAHQRENGVLNVNPKIGQWNVHVLGEQTVHLRAELVIQGLSGQDGYVFRCGSQEEGAVASKLDQLLDQEESRSFIPPTPQLEEEAFEPPFESAWQVEEGANFAGMRQAFEGVESEEAPEDDWLIESPVQEGEHREADEETEIVFTPDPAIVFPMPDPDTDWARQLDAADRAFSGQTPYVTPFAGARELTRAYEPQPEPVAEPAPEFTPEFFANEQFAKEQFAPDRSTNLSVADESFAQEGFAIEPDGTEKFATERFGDQPVVKEDFSTERFVNEPVAKDDFAQEGFAIEPDGTERFATERFGDQPVAKQDFATDRFVNEPVAKEDFATERFVNEPVAKEDFAPDRFANEPVAREDFSPERFAKEDFAPERFTNEAFAREGFAQEGFGQEEFEQQFEITSEVRDEQPHVNAVDHEEAFSAELERPEEDAAELTEAEHAMADLAAPVAAAPEIEAEYHFEDELPEQEVQAIPAVAQLIEPIEHPYPFAKSTGPKLSVGGKGVTMQTDEPIKLSALLGDSRAQAVEALAESAYIESGSLTESAQLIRESLSYAESYTHAADASHAIAEASAPVYTSEQGHHSDSIWGDLLFGGRETKTTMKFRIVQEDESLPDLAEHYNTPLNELLRANNLQQNHVDAGQILYIPQRRR